MVGASPGLPSPRFLALALASFGAAVAFAEHPWGQFGRSAAHAWRGGSPGPLALPTEAWRGLSNLTRPCVSEGGPLSTSGTCSDFVYGSAAASSDGRVFFVSHAGCLYAFDTANGLSLFPPCKQPDPQAPVVLSSPALSADGSTVYVCDSAGGINALASNDAHVVWTFNHSGPIRGSPAVGDDGRVYAASADSYLYALNHDGTLAWRSASTGSFIESTPALSDQGTVFVSGDGVLYAFSKDDGHSLWNSSFGARGQPPGWWEMLSSPSLSDDASTVYVGSWAARCPRFPPTLASRFGALAHSAPRCRSMRAQ